MSFGLGKKSGNTFYCFSPQIMVLTFAAEMLLMMFVLVKHGLHSMSHRLVVFLLLLLAIFQLSEYGVCEQLGLDNLVWARIGFVAITLLPAVGLHLIQEVRNDKNLNISHIGYLLSLLFTVTFVFFNSFESVGCNGNYAIFELSNALSGAYFTYYYLLLLTGAILAFSGWRGNRESGRSRTLLLIVTGYASFVLPATFIHFAFDNVSSGLPSIMCGFALVFAFILALVIAKRLPADEA